MKKSSSKQACESHATTLVRWVLLVVIVGASTQCFAASQGSWGTSSSATLKITLRILPPNHGQTLSVAGDERNLKGHTAVQAYCAASSSSFAQTSKLFTANLPGRSQDAEFDHLLRASCPGESAPISSSQHQPDSHRDQLTVLVSPV